MWSAGLLGSAALALVAALWPPAAADSGNVAPLGGGAADSWEADLHGGDVGRRLAAIIRLGTLVTPRRLEEIRPFLDAPDSAVRLAAARALVRAGDEQALARVGAQASDSSAAVRFEALTVLREAASLPRAGREAAERALSDADAGTRLLALDVLTIHRSSDSVPSIATVLADGNRDVRFAAVRHLGLVPDGRALLPLLERLETADRTERVAVIDALSRFAGKHPRLEAGPGVLRQLSDSNDDVNAAAVDALGSLRWAPAVAALRPIASHHPQERLARRAALALGRIATPDAIATLVDLLRTPAPTEEVVTALTGAGPAAVSALSALLPRGGGGTTSVIAAIHILGEIGDRAATPALARALTTSATAAPAIAAARALGTLGDPAAVPSLMAAVSAPRYAEAPGVREACVNALVMLRDARSAALIENLARSADPRLRVAALMLAAAVQAGMTTAGLTVLLDDTEPEVRLAAVETAARLPRLHLVGPLVKAALRGGGTSRDDETIAEILETLVTRADRALLFEALGRAPSPRRHLLLPALAATAGPAPGTPLPRALASALVELVSRGSSESSAAAEALVGFALDAGTIHQLVVALPALTSSSRTRLCPSFAQARSTEADRALMDLLARDPEPGVRAAAAWAMAARAAEPTFAATLHQAAGAPGGAPAAVAANAQAARARARPHLPSSGESTPEPADNIASARWLRVRVRAPDGTPITRRWVAVDAGALRVWALTDAVGACAFPDLPAGPYRFSAGAAGEADSLVLTTAMASGRSPATTPVEP